MPSTAVQNALDTIYGKNVLTGVSNVQLASVPTEDTSLFPNGFPANYHPVLVSSGYDDDIRMGALQIDGPLLNGQLGVPYVRRFDSQPSTILNAELNGYLSGDNGNTVAGLVPATVSTLIEGFATRLGQFAPNNAAYQLNDDVYSNTVAWNVLPNPISGPGVYIEALDMTYLAASSLQNTTPKLFKVMLNQPGILTGVIGDLVGNLCQRNQYYFNNLTSTMFPRSGNVTLGPAADGLGPQLTGTLQAASPDGSGVYSFLEGFSGCAQGVGFNPENCDDASNNVDPTSL